jgi:hypothetical protein
MKRIFVCCLLLALPPVFAQQDSHSALNMRGDHEMGFSHEKTTHHFQLNEDGGIIEIRANDIRDVESRDRIRTHLEHVARMFAAGDFNVPMLVHARMDVPGTAAMSKLKDQLHWDFQETSRGAKLLITADNEPALEAVHDFLRFQIEDHHTGDCPMVR